MLVNNRWTRLTVLFTVLAVVAAMSYVIRTQGLLEFRPVVASALPDLEREDFVAQAYERLKLPYFSDFVNQIGYLDHRHPAFVVALHGNPDEATEAIIDLIENRADPTPAAPPGASIVEQRNSISFRHHAYESRIHALTALGITKTQRAEEFLLQAFEHPETLLISEKYKRLRTEPQSQYVPRLPSGLGVDAMIVREALVGLLFLDVERAMETPKIETRVIKWLEDGPYAPEYVKTIRTKSAEEAVIELYYPFTLGCF